MVLVAAMAGAVSPAARADSRVEAWVADLSGEDELARSQARQFLAREGIEAFRAVCPLLGHEDPRVWTAADNLLCDLCSELSAPGREAERKEAAKLLMALVAPEEPAEVRGRVLRLLPVVVPEGFSVAPVLAMLKEDEWREPARRALEEMGTEKAAKGIVQEFSSAEPEFQAALLSSVARLRAPYGLGKVESLARSKDARVRAAAARALAWRGEPRHKTAVLAVLAEVDETLLNEAGYAALAYAEALAAREEFGIAREVYAAVLEVPGGPGLRGAALVGMGRLADRESAPEVVAAIMAAVAGPEGRDLEPAALAAFDAVCGKAAHDALIAAYGQASRDMQAGMMGVFARKHDAAYLDMLAAGTKSPDEFLRNEAYAALEECRCPGAVDILLVTEGNTWYVRESLKRMALAAQLRGDSAVMQAATNAFNVLK